MLRVGILKQCLIYWKEATIINAVTGNPMVRTFVLCKLIILSFFSSWNLKDAETGNIVPINSENIGKTRHEIIRAFSTRMAENNKRKIKC